VLGNKHKTTNRAIWRGLASLRIIDADVIRDYKQHYATCHLADKLVTYVRGGHSGWPVITQLQGVVI